MNYKKEVEEVLTQIRFIKNRLAGITLNMDEEGREPAILTIMPEGSGESKGTQLGVQEGIELGKPMFTAHGVEDAAEIAEWLRSLEMARIDT